VVARRHPQTIQRCRRSFSECHPRSRLRLNPSSLSSSTRGV
jgi:hypothetical protein